MTAPAGLTRGRLAALAFALALLSLGALAAATAVLPIPPRFALPWPVLVPLYLVASRLSLEFQRREGSVGFTLVQLPLALGVVLVAPGFHLIARLLASAALSAVRRHDPLKFVCNLGFASLEVGVAALAVAQVAPLAQLGPRLWVALLVGLVVGEVASFLALNVVLRLVGMQVTRRQLVEPIVFAMLTSTVWAGLAILTISAAWTDGSTVVVVVGLSAGLAVFSRVHRRMSAQQQATEDLYAFMKDLGPVDIEQPAALDALEHVRGLLHARHLELTAASGSPDQFRHLAVHLEGAPEARTTPAAALVQKSDLHDDSMITPLLAGGNVLGLLRARQHVGSDRGFDMRDLRLLETIATELATALDRGRLLRDLGRAATTDPLTDLPNLASTTNRIDDLIASEGEVLVAAIAVESFREVNDTLGHQVGDDLLREVAQRLQRCAPQALVGRTGGGRFTVAVTAREVGGDVALFGLGLRAQVEGPAQLAGVGTHVRLSVGCARVPQDGRDAGTVLRRAETAMYGARHAHGGPVLWEPAYEVQGQRRLAVVMALREALASGAIGVAFQPKVAASDGCVEGVEALARWTHPALGSISPAEFVPLAEAAGLMRSLTSTVLRQSLTACRGWQGRSPGVGVSVNVSADTVQDAGFVTEVSAVLSSTGVAPGLLTLELTEDVVVADPQLAAERMHELQALGVLLSVDDFGTGYSSLTYLKGLPINEVKIDQGFVAGLVDDPGDQAVVRAVVDIAHTLGMTVVAEGVEQEDQHVLLRLLGVDAMQGYLHARPMPALDMAAWLRRRASSRPRPAVSP